MTNLQNFKTLFAHRSLRLKIMEISLWKIYLWTQQLLLDTRKYEHCNFVLRHFFFPHAFCRDRSQVKEFLRQLRSRRRHAPNQQCRKELSLQIRSLHRKEVRSWKTQNLAEHLEDVSKWKCLKTWRPNPVGRAMAQHPLEDEFADMLDNLFVGPVVSLPKPVVLTEDDWTVQQLRIAIGRLQLKKSPDQRGVSAGLLQHIPEEFLRAFASNLRVRVGGWGSSRLLADNLFSTCCRTKCVLCMQVISGQLLTYVCCTRFLHI